MTKLFANFIVIKIFDEVFVTKLLTLPKMHNKCQNDKLSLKPHNSKTNPTSYTLVSLILQKIGMNKLPTMMSDITTNLNNFSPKDQLEKLPLANLILVNYFKLKTP